MLREIAEIGDKIELKRLNMEYRTSRKSKVYVSQLLDFLDDDKVVIAMPIEKSHIVPLSVGEKYTLTIYTNKGLYQCNVSILNRYKNKNVYVLEVQVVSEIEKKQRRQYFRLNCIIDILYHIITDAEVKLENKYNQTTYTSEEEKEEDYKNLEALKSVWYEGTITDISGGGTRFVSNRIHESGENIIIHIVLEINGDGREFKIPARIIASTKMLNRAGFYEHRVEYTDIRKEDREDIIKFIFAEERRQRKREKGLD